MKLQTDNSQEISTNLGQSTGFTIKNSPKAFQILSSGLYSNKIGAIIRELSCNCVDSHKAKSNLYKKGSNTPYHSPEGTTFDVHLPNSLEPYFYVRDYGIGLDHVGVTELYTTYFESTKQDSDDFIGALGLGSKSPFSYTNNFTVTSTFDGVTSTYLAFIGEDGCPSITKMNEVPTKDIVEYEVDGKLVNTNALYNGIEVRMAVESTNDIRSFTREAEEIFTWFKDVPNIVGCSRFTIPEQKFKFENIAPGMSILSGRSYHSYAIQGNIAYPIEFPDSVIGKQPKYVSKLLNAGIVIDFKIGELDIAASREGLSYIPLTIDNILAKIKLLNDRLDSYIDKEVKKHKNEWDKSYALNKLGSENIFSESVNAYVKAGKCKIMEINQKFGYSSPALKPAYSHWTPQYLDKLGVSVDLNSFSYHNASKSYRLARYDVNKTQKRIPIMADKDTHFVYDTGASAIRIRLAHRYSDSSDLVSNVVYFKNLDDKPMKPKMDIIMKDLLHPEVELIDSSTLERPPAATYIKGAIQELKNVSRYYWNTESYLKWQPSNKTFEDSEVMYYVPLSNHNVLNKSGNIYPSFLDNVWRRLKGAGFTKNIELYGVRKNMIKDIEQDSRWVPIWDLLDALVTLVDIELIYLQKTKSLLERSTFGMRFFMDMHDKIETDSGIGLVCKRLPKEIFSNRPDLSKVSKLESLLSGTNTPIPTTYEAKYTEIKEELAKHEEAYPLLEYIPDRKVELIVDYIELVNQSLQGKEND